MKHLTAKGVSTMAIKEIRNLTVIEQAGAQYKPIPTIMLKGQWLKVWGFEIGDKVEVKCEDGKLVIMRNQPKI